jgi:hypothetical protein
MARSPAHPIWSIYGLLLALTALCPLRLCPFGSVRPSPPAAAAAAAVPPSLLGLRSLLLATSVTSPPAPRTPAVQARLHAAHGLLQRLLCVCHHTHAHAHARVSPRRCARTCVWRRARHRPSRAGACTCSRARPHARAACPNTPTHTRVSNTHTRACQTHTHARVKHTHTHLPGAAHGHGLAHRLHHGGQLRLGACVESQEGCADYYSAYIYTRVYKDMTMYRYMVTRIRYAGDSVMELAFAARRRQAPHSCCRTRRLTLYGPTAGR